MFNNQKTEFADESIWNDAKKKQVIRRLVDITLSRSSRGFCLRVTKADYDAAIPAEKRDIVGRNHFCYAIRAAIGFIEDWRIKNDIRDPIEYIFDRTDHPTTKEEIERIFAEAEMTDDALRKYGIYQGCLSFRDKAQILPLQGADILAWLSQRAEAYQQGTREMQDYLIETWNRILTSGKVYAKEQTRKALEEFIAKDPKALVTLPPDWLPPSRMTKP
jgi:hypothetical protein